jgi:hypothetical protein
MRRKNYAEGLGRTRRAVRSVQRLVEQVQMVRRAITKCRGGPARTGRVRECADQVPFLREGGHPTQRDAGALRYYLPRSDGELSQEKIRVLVDGQETALQGGRASRRGRRG